MKVFWSAVCALVVSSVAVGGELRGIVQSSRSHPGGNRSQDFWLTNPALPKLGDPLRVVWEEDRCVLTESGKHCDQVQVELGGLSARDVLVSISTYQPDGLIVMGSLQDEFGVRAMELYYSPTGAHLGTLQLTATDRERSIGDQSDPGIWQFTGALYPYPDFWPPLIPGDANNDGIFNSRDLVQVFAAGNYDTGRDATWETGDWNRDGVFNSGDLVTAFQGGNYERGVPIPEPDSLVLLLLSVGVLLLRR